LKLLRACHLLSLLSFYFASASTLDAQTGGKSHEECLKLVPRDWGPNFGAKWHHHEAIYWGCRLGVPIENVETWQQVADVTGMIQDVLPATIEKQEFVFIEVMEGSMHCYSVTALMKTAKGWEQVWSIGGEQYCTVTCPPVRMKTRGSYLTLELPSPSDEKCIHISWRKENYLWNGKTFEPKNAELPR
jgi:hypothetical protein